MIASLQKQYQRQQDRLDRMYIDKLDGAISQDYFDRMSGAFQKERDDILRKTEQHQSAHETYLEEGVRLLELAQRAVILYEKQEMQEKRRLLDFVCSNSTWKDERLIQQYRKPFDFRAVTNKSYQKTKATSPEESGLCPSLRAGPFSNQRPSGEQPSALPTELPGNRFLGSVFHRQHG